MQMTMGTEENEDHSVSLTDEPSEVTQEEPIEQVMTQDTADSGASDYSDQEAFEETAKFEEVELEPSVTKRKITNKARKTDSKLISNLGNKLKRYTDSGRKTDTTIKDIQRKIKDLDKRISRKHHQVIRELQAQVKELRRKIDRIERLSRSTKSATLIKKTSSKNKKSTKKK